MIKIKKKEENRKNYMLNYTLICGKMSCRLSNHTMLVHFKHNYTLLTNLTQTTATKTAKVQQLQKYS